jgi:hypothetical protein
VNALVEQVKQSPQREVVAALGVRAIVMGHAPIGYRVRASGRESRNALTGKRMAAPELALAERRLGPARRFARDSQKFASR